MIIECSNLGFFIHLLSPSRQANTRGSKLCAGTSCRLFAPLAPCWVLSLFTLRCLVFQDDGSTYTTGRGKLDGSYGPGGVPLKGFAQEFLVIGAAPTGLSETALAPFDGLFMGFTQDNSYNASELQNVYNWVQAGYISF